MYGSKVIAKFFGDEKFPVEWENEEEKKLHWWFDDLHCPHPVSTMYADMSGWWGPTANYAFGRFRFPGEKQWPGKIVNGYVYSAVVPSSPEETQRDLKYYLAVKDTYAVKFDEWWHTRFLPEIIRNFTFLDNYDYQKATLEELMIILEDAKDIYLRHWQIHWILNFAQFFAFLAFKDLYKEIFGQANDMETGQILTSFEDKNWESIKGVWELKEMVNAREPLRRAFEKEDPKVVLKDLEGTAEGREFLALLSEYLKEFGHKAIYAHEFIYSTWIEDSTPVIELIRTYIKMGYNYYQDFYRLKKERDDAIARMFAQVKNDRDRQRLEASLDLALKLAPLTPNHHFYVDQGTNARMRRVFIEIGKKLVQKGIVAQPDDVLFLKYEELRTIASEPRAFDAKALSAQRRSLREKQFKLQPVNFLGTVTEWSAYQEPWKLGLWGWTLEEKKLEKNVFRGIAASPGVVEGFAKVVLTPEDFNKVQPGDIVICEMTNPAWITIFPKMKALVTDSGGLLSHPAVVSREFGIPCVVATGIATRTIKEGQRVQVDGSKGTVELLS